MSKNKTPDPSDAEDYLAQLDWQSKQWHSRRATPWYLVPKWKYKAIQTRRKNSIFVNTFVVGFFVIVIGYMLYSSIVYRSGHAIFGSIFVFIVGVVLFFAARDAFKKRQDD